jgi:hypothetical protein
VISCICGKQFYVNVQLPYVCECGVQYGKNSLVKITAADIACAENVLDREVRSLAKDFMRDKKVIAVT